MNKSYKYSQFIQNLNNRPYRIGLDLGVGSIGFAVVALNYHEDKTIPSDLILEGSRIFTSSIGSAERRTQRGQRNAHQHKRNRLLLLWKILAGKGMMLPFVKHKQRLLTKDTSSIMFSKEVLKFSPYDLRLKSLNEKLTLSELGYALYHLANHRGSSSVRINLEATQEDKDAQKSILETQNFSQQNPEATTFIELLTLNNNLHKGFRNKLNRANNLMPTRNLILNELEKICISQQTFYPEIFTEEFVTYLTNIINYENEKIVPDAGNCPYFSNEIKLPKCHFLNEERRLWEALNNARIDNERLTMEQKEKFFEILRSGVDLTSSMVKKEINDNHADITLQGRSKKDQKIAGFRFKNLEDKSFWARLSEEQQDCFFATWTNCADDNKLLHILQEEFCLSLDEANDAFMTINLIGDYSPIGKSAMIIVLDYIKNHDLSYQESLIKAIEDGKLQELTNKDKIYELLPYYGEILNDTTQPLIGKAWHSTLKEKFINESNRYVTPNTNKHEQKYGRIANPVVHQTLNEVRKLVNEIIFVLGAKPTEIGIELARELKIGAEERENIIKNQNIQEKDNSRIIEDYNLVDEKLIIRIKLAEEQSWLCPYCLQQFNADEVKSGNVDIDHILPYSQSADNSRNNLVMSHKHCNETIKGNKTPYGAFYGTDKWSEIEHYVKETLPNKAWRFTLTQAQYQEWLNHRGFLARFSTDTSYISKATAIYLQCLFEDKSKRNVRTLKGGETATLRKAWGLQGITHELGSRFVDDENGVYYHPAKKMRLDHRHHALDAITIAYSTNGYSKLINTLSNKGFKLHGIQKMIPLPQITKIYAEESVDSTSLGDKETFIHYIKDRLQNHAMISIKYDHDKNGQLLKDTPYTILLEKDGQLVLVTKKKIQEIKETINDIDKALLPKMYTEDKLSNYTEYEQEKLQKLLTHNKNKRENILYMMENAEKELIAQNEELKSEGKSERKIDDKAIIKKALMNVGGFYYQISNKDKNKIFVKTEPAENQTGVAYDTGENLRIDLYHDVAGKLCGEVIRKVNAMKRDFIPEYKKSGYSCIESIYQGDTLEINLVDRKTLTEKSSSLENAASVKAPNAPTGRTFVRVATFTEIGNNGCQIFLQNLLKAKKGSDASFTVSSMRKWDVRRVVLSPIGLIKYRSPILKDKS